MDYRTGIYLLNGEAICAIMLASLPASYHFVIAPCVPGRIDAKELAVKLRPNFTYLTIFAVLLLFLYLDFCFDPRAAMNPAFYRTEGSLDLFKKLQ